MSRPDSASMVKRMPKRPMEVLGGDYRQCARKRPYSKRTALKVASAARRRTRDNIWPYRCDRCGSWHVGHVGKGAPEEVDA